MLPVFPAHAGMILALYMTQEYYGGIPRASRDDPRAELELVEKKLYSPREQG